MFQAEYYWPDYDLINFSEYWPSAYCVQLSRKMMACVVMTEGIKLLKFVRRVPVLNVIQRTFEEARDEILVFGLLFVLILAIMSQAFLLVFSSDVSDFSTMQRSMFTLFRALIGDVDVDGIIAADRIFGAVFLTLYIFFVLFTMLTILIAIVSDGYVKAGGSVSKYAFVWTELPDPRAAREEGFMAKLYRNVKLNAQMMQMQEKASYHIRSGNVGTGRRRRGAGDGALAEGGELGWQEEGTRLVPMPTMTPCAKSLAQHLQRGGSSSKLFQPRESVGGLGPELAEGLRPEFEDLAKLTDEFERGASMRSTASEVPDPETPHAAELISRTMRRNAAEAAGAAGHPGTEV